MKICTVCKINKPYTEFHKDKAKIDGYQYRCKECKKQYYHDNFVIYKQNGAEYYRNNIDKIRQYMNKYNIDNADKISQYGKEYRIDNDEYIKQYMTKYRIDNPEYFKQYMEQYHLDNADKISDYIRQYGKEYRQTPHGKAVIKSHNHKRRALLQANTPIGKHFTPEDIILKLKLQKNKCVYCKTCIKDYHEIDHFIPAIKGGSNEAWNIQLLCFDCNRGKDGKHTKLPTEYAQKHGKLF